MNRRIGIITGASSGIGREVALELAAQGCNLILTARNSSILEELKKEIITSYENVGCEIVIGDMTDAAVILECIQKCHDTWQSGPNLFVASAGRGLPGNLLTSDQKEWQALWDLNVMSLMDQLKQVTKTMLSNETRLANFVDNPTDIVVIGSSIGRNVSPFNSIYGATKFATHGLTEALRRDVGSKGIRVTLIEPGLVKTNFQASAGYDPAWFEDYEKEIGPILIGKDIAKVISLVVTLPGNVNLDDISIRPTKQIYP
jgi:NADP-dependent 3-hydroxy acid dehydrogenase YdfG